jgi:hypothetical protein
MIIRANVVEFTAEQAAASRERLDVLELDAWGAWSCPEAYYRGEFEAAADILVYHACTAEHRAHPGSVNPGVQQRVVQVPWTCPACQETLTQQMAERVESLQQPMP